jgi:hypothetical protein
MATRARLVAALGSVVAICSCVDLGALETGSHDGGNSGDGPSRDARIGDEIVGTDSAHDAAGHDAPSDDALTDSPDGTEFGCPSSPPPPGGACQPPGIACEYGGNENPNCNPIFECIGTWTPRLPGKCPDPSLDCPPKPGLGCSSGLLACSYPEVDCFCSGSSMLTFHCVDASPGCPIPRPRIGAACGGGPVASLCNYEACNGGVAIACSGGYWQEQIATCTDSGSGTDGSHTFEGGPVSD